MVSAGTKACARPKRVLAEDREQVNDRMKNIVSWRPLKDADQRSNPMQAPGPVRARSELEREERANQRRLDLAVQRSELNPPTVRIRAWEKLHGLQLPLDPAHPILDVIALGTRLTLAEVHAEQVSRASRVHPVELDQA
jgi:hypothetical protein